MVDIIIYTKDYCPFCHRAKALLDNKGVEYKEIDYFTLSHKEQQELLEKTNHYTSVPQIFIGKKFIGGFDQLHALNENGELDKLLTA